MFKLNDNSNKQLHTERYRSGDVLRALPVADEASNKEWQRSKFCEANSEQKISGTATGHNGADSKGSQPHHLRERKSSCFLAKSLKFFIFLEFWMTAFHLRPCKSRAKFKLNLIRRDIEVVITGLTRNQFESNLTRVRIPLSPPNRPQFSRIAVFLLHYISSKNLNLQVNYMRTKKVVVLPYDVAWQSALDKIKGEIKEAIGDLIIGVEHVGSTSVKGISAKPCIDIDVIIKDYSAFAAVVDGLNAIGYVHEGDLGIKDREAFKYTDKPHLMMHHLYVCPQYSEELHRHITFRDFLRSNPEAVRKYSLIKEKAAELFPNDIDGYIEYKSPCIEELYKECGLK